MQKKRDIKNGLEERNKKTECNKELSNGMQQGVENNKVEIAKKMLSMKVDINIIIESTGLSREKIEKIQSENI